MRCQESATSQRDSLDEEGQKCKVAYCSGIYYKRYDYPRKEKLYLLFFFCEISIASVMHR